jgi:hypothetical protein
MTAMDEKEGDEKEMQKDKSRNVKEDSGSFFFREDGNMRK